MSTIELRAESSVLPSDTHVLAFRGVEAISTPYAFEIVFRTTDTDLDGVGAVGVPITLLVTRHEVGIFSMPKTWRTHGVVTSLEICTETSGHALYRITFAPRLFLLTLSRHSRIFTQQSIPAIVRAVLADEGLAGDAVKLELEGDYPEREHVCQYEESSFAFVSRLMEREGLFYFFEHDGDREVMVIADDLSRYASLDCGPVKVVERGFGDADTSRGEAFVDVEVESLALPGRVVLHDYDELNPTLDLAGEVFVQDSRRRIVDYGEHLFTADEAQRYARVRAQVLGASDMRLHARGGVVGLHAGGTFAFEEPSAWRPAECLVVAVEHAGASEAPEPMALEILGLDAGFGHTLSTDATLLPADVQFRAAQVTPWPSMSGVEVAVIDGSVDSIYAQLDNHGRYKVRFLFDEGDLVDGSRSTWVRMLEPHGGSPEGFHFPLRKGTEVSIAFLGGNPDRPAIVGVAPNALKPSTVTASNNTRNVVRTGSNNLWELEDQAGSQRVLMSTPPLATHLHLGTGAHQFELRTDGLGLLHYGADLDVSVGATKTETVASDLSETYRATHALDVTGPSLRTLETSHTHTVLGPVDNTLLSTLDETVQAFVGESYSSTLSTHAVGATTFTDDGTLTMTVNAAPEVERIASSRTITVGATGTITVSGAAEEEYGATTRNVHGGFSETITGTYTIKAPKMLVYAGDASIVDQGINALESGVTWINAFVTAHVDSDTSITGVALTAMGLQLQVTGVAHTKTPLSLTLAGALIDLAALRIMFDGVQIQAKAVRMALKALHIVV